MPIGGANNRKSPILNTQLFQHLSYTVCLPQFRQTKFNVGEQSDGIVANSRFTPKFGAAFYPTVKYTIIAYEQSPMLSNNNDSGLSPGNNYTYVQTDIGGGVAGALLAYEGETYEAQAPFSNNFSTVYIP